MARRIFVGDVQGCREELEALLEEARFDSAADALHPVGDLVNRGPDSAGALRLLRSLGALPVLGNHDLALLARVRGERPPKAGDTFDDVLVAPDREELVAWLQAQPFVRSFDAAVLVHAGLSPAWADPIATLSRASIEAPSDDTAFAVRARYCDAEGNLPAEDGAPPAPPFAPWHQLFDRARIGGRTVVFGHWASQGLLVAEGLRGLDSGCVWGGRLSAWIAEDDRIVSVPARRAYARIAD